MGDVFRTGERRPVMFRVGSFDDGRPKFAKAPFDVLIWGEGENKDQLIVTNGIGGPDDIDAYVNASDVEFDAQHYRNEFGWLGESIVVEEHELGSDQEGWKGVHSFGLV